MTGAHSAKSTQSAAPHLDRWRSVTRTHVGRVRSVNEDRVHANASRSIWALADGMGGHGGGDVAAQIAVDRIAQGVESDCLPDAFDRANRAIFRHGGGHSGTTLVACRIEADVAHIHWVGDSRAYLLRDGALNVLTQDHSVVEELVAAGLVERAQAARHPQAHILTRALGTAAQVTVDTVRIALQPGDRLMLCSDGLSRTLEDGDGTSVQGLAALADRLLANALSRDGSDNISLILIEAAGSA